MSITLTRPQQHYQLITKIHKLLPKINQKYSLEIKVESDFVFGFHKITDNIQRLSTDLAYHLAIDNLFEHHFFDVDDKVIRQILVDVKDVLDVNDEMLDATAKTFAKTYELDKEKVKSILIYSGFPISLSEWYCREWVDGLDTMFKREPLTVLKEFKNLLESLLK